MVVAALAVAACSGGLANETTTTSTTTGQPTTTVLPTTTSTRGRAIGGQLVKLELPRFEPVRGLDPIPFGLNSWSMISEDGEWVVILDWAEVTPIEVGTWTPTGTFDVSRHSARAVHDDRLYMYDEVSGRLLTMDLTTGHESTLGRWRTGLSIWDELHVMSGERIAALGASLSQEEEADYSLFWLDTVSGDTGEIPIGPIARINVETGIFDGGYEIPEYDDPGVVWGEDRLYIAHAVGPEVTVVDLDNGDVLAHSLEASSWWDRFLAYWAPAAVAKGPSLGTNSSAALSADGRFLFISGNRYDVVVTDDGSLLEESEHLGLTVVDTETWEVVAGPDLPIQFVRNAGDTILAVDTTSTSPWLDDVYVMSIDGSGAVTVEGPFTVQEGGCQPASDTTYLICSEYVSDTTQRLRVVDMATSETVSEREVGWEDYLNDNGVFVDWSPFDG